MAEEVENNANEEDVDNSEVAKLYRRLFDSFQEYLNNGGHAYVLDDSGYFDQFGFDAGDRKHAEELNSYANRKAIESVKKAGQELIHHSPESHHIFCCVHHLFWSSLLCESHQFFGPANQVKCPFTQKIIPRAIITAAISM